MDGVWRYAAGVMCVPADAARFQLRLCIISHSGSDGHRGFCSRVRTLQSSFSGRLWQWMWKTLSPFPSIAYKQLVAENKGPASNVSNLA